jgi:hypothetical protein
MQGLGHRYVISLNIAHSVDKNIQVSEKVSPLFEFRYVKKGLNRMSIRGQLSGFFVHEVTDRIFLRNGAFIIEISKKYLQKVPSIEIYRNANIFIVIRRNILSGFTVEFSLRLTC